MSDTSVTRVPLTPRTLVQRLNRQLNRTGMKLLRYRGDRPDMGKWFVVDVVTGEFKSKNIDLEKLGRQFALILPWEDLT